MRRLLDAYAHACDANDSLMTASLFDPDGELVVRGVSYRGEELRQFYESRFTIDTEHFMSGIVITPRNGDLVDVTCRLFAIAIGSAETETSPAGVTASLGRYCDVVRIADGQATFVRRTIEVANRVVLGETQR